MMSLCLPTIWPYSSICSATITSPQRRQLHLLIGGDVRTPVSRSVGSIGSSRGETGQRRASEEADGGNDQARADRPGGHEGRHGPEDGSEVRDRRQAAVGDADAALLAHAA